MPRTKLAKPNASPLVPFFPRLGSTFPSFEDFNKRAKELMTAALAGAPEFPPVDWFPAVNVSEADGEFTVTAELPGLTAKDVTVDFCDGTLTIRGEKTEEETKKEDDRTYYRWERQFGSFQRSFPFPGGIDEGKIAAEFKDGILTVHLPKAEEAKVKHREIAITEKK
ncbi:MAG: Hsp20/alpha crystallin family protein [Gemmatimonadota bacterium]